MDTEYAIKTLPVKNVKNRKKISSPKEKYCDFDLYITIFNKNHDFNFLTITAATVTIIQPKPATITHLSLASTL